MPARVEGGAVEPDLPLQRGQGGVAGDGPGIGEARHALDHLVVAGRHHDRRAGLLEGARGEADVVQVEVRAVKGHRLLGPQPLHHLEGFEKAGQPPAPGNPEGVELDVAVAEADAEHEAAAADHVQGGDGLGHVHRLLERQQHDAGAERHVPGFSCHARQDRHGLHVLERRGEVVLAGADVVKARLPGQPHRLQQLREPLAEVIAHRMLHRQRQPETHSLSPISRPWRTPPGRGRAQPVRARAPPAQSFHLEPPSL